MLAGRAHAPIDPWTGEVVTNAFVRGHFTKDRWRLVPGSLLCL